jgi:hypothetical protein
MIMRGRQRYWRIGRRTGSALWLRPHASYLIDLRDGLYLVRKCSSLYFSLTDTHTCLIDGSSTLSVRAGSGRGRERSSGPRLLSHIMSLGEGSRDGTWMATADMLGGVVDGGASFNCGWVTS